MDYSKLSVVLLTAIAVCGLIVLLALGKSVDVLLPVVSALVGYVIGDNRVVVGKKVRSFLGR
jgi:hypothetical protein